MSFIQGLISWIAGNSIAQSVLLSYALGKVQEMLTDEPQIQDFDKGLKVNNTSNTHSIPVVYGRARIGGSEYRGVSGNDNEFLHRCLILCEGEIDSVENVYFNDRLSTDSDIAGLVSTQVKTGTATQTHNTIMSDVTGWSSSHRGVKIAYIATKMTWNRDVWASGLPRLTCDVKGKKVYDPRLDSSLTTTEYLPSLSGGHIILDNVPSSVLSGQHNYNASNKRFEKTGSTSTQYFAYNASLNKWSFTYSGGTISADSESKFPWESSWNTGVTRYWNINTDNVTYGAGTGGSHRYDNETTWAWSENPALCILDYLTNPIYGRGIPHTDIDLDSFMNEADYCDELVQMKDELGNNVMEKRYTCNGVVNTNAKALDNLRDLLFSCRGHLLPPSEKFKLVIDKPRNDVPVFTFDKTNIIGNWAIQGKGIRQIKNKITVSFQDKNNRGDTSISVTTNTNNIGTDVYKTADNNRELSANIKLPYTNEQKRADILAQHLLKQTRLKWSVSFTATLEAFKVEAMDVVYIKHSTLGWDSGDLANGKKFRVSSVELLSEDTIKITAEEYDNSVYTFDVFTPQESPSTTLPLPNQTRPPTALTLDGTSYMINKSGNIVERILASWTAPSYAYVDHFEIAWRESQTDSFTIVATDDTSFTISPVNSAVTASDGASVFSGQYYVKVRTVHPDGKRSSWYPADEGQLVMISGKTALPNQPQGFYYTQGNDYTRQLNYVDSPDPDIAGYKIRFAETNSTPAYNTMSELHTGLINHSAYETSQLPQGTYAFAIKAVDTSGNESAERMITNISVTDDPSMDILKAYYPRQLGWDTVGKIGEPSDDARKTLKVTMPWMPSGQQDIEFNYIGQQNVLDYWGSGDDVNFAYYESLIYNNITVIDSNGDSQPDANSTGKWVIARSKGGSVDKYYIYFRGITSGIVTNTPYWSINTNSSHPELVPEGTYTFHGGVSGGTNPSSLTLTSDFDINVSSVLDSPATETIDGVVHLRVKFAVSEYTHWTIQHTQNLSGSWTDIESGIAGSGVTELKRSFSTSTYPSPAYFRITGYAPNGNIVPYPATNGGVIDALSGDIDSVAGNNAEWQDLGTTTWDNWQYWGFASETLIYETYGFEFGTTLTFRPIIQSTQTGAVTHQIKIVPDSVAGTSGFSQSDYVDLDGNNNFFDPNGNITAKAIKTKSTVTGVNATLSSLGILLDGKQVEEITSSLDTSSIASSLIIGAGHIKVPLSTEFTSINTMQISFVGGGAGQSFEIVDKTSTDSNGKLAPTIKTYNSSGNLAHSTIDITTKGY